MPRRPALWVLDTSIFVAYLRAGLYRDFLRGGLERGTILLPGVVLSELYAGAISRADRADVEALRRAVERRVVEIETEDWVLAGRCLSEYSRRWGRIKPRDHLADVLVAVSASKIGAVLGSRDLSQTRCWRQVLAKLGRTLEVSAVAELTTRR